MTDRSAPARVVDASGHRCPVPTLRLQRALGEVALGETVQLIADDPMARVDVPLFVREAGHVLLEISEASGRLSFVVEKACASPAGAASASD